MLDFASIAPRLSVLVSDFDGVFTDNRVYVDSKGNEIVACSKSDSLAIDIYRKSQQSGLVNFGFIVVSTETNAVVSNRCRKLKLESFTGIQDKAAFLADKYNSCLNSFGVLEGFLYLGNDLNDLGAISLCEYSAAPCDADPVVLNAVDYTSKFAGGNGFVRDVITKLLS